MDIGFRAKLSVNDGFPLLTGGDPADNAFVEFPGLLNFGFPKRKVGEKDVTAHDNLTVVDGKSVPDYHKVYIPTLIESDMVPVEGHYTAATFRRLDALLGRKKIGPTDPKVVPQFVLTAPPVEAAGKVAAADLPQKLTVYGYVASLEGPTFGKEDEMVLKFEVRVNGRPAVADGKGVLPVTGPSGGNV